MNVGEVLPTISKYMGGQPGVFPDSMVGSSTRTLMAGLLGAGVGRFIAAPAINALGMGYTDKKKVNRNMALAGALTGLLGSGIPAYYDWKAVNNPTPFYKRSMFGMGTQMFTPSIPVANSLQDVQRNPWMSMSDKMVAQVNLMSAAQREGDDMHGLVSPISLVNFAGQTAATALPTVVAAYGLSKVLGLPDSIRNTMMGTGLVAGAWKTYLDRSNQ